MGTATPGIATFTEAWMEAYDALGVSEEQFQRLLSAAGADFANEIVGIENLNRAIGELNTGVSADIALDWDSALATNEISLYNAAIAAQAATDSLEEMQIEMATLESAPPIEVHVNVVSDSIGGAVSKDEAEAAAGAGGGTPSDIGGGIGTAGLGDATAGMGDFILSIDDALAAVQDLGVEWQDIDDLSRQLGLDLRNASIFADEFFIALDNVAYSTGAASEAIAAADAQALELGAGFQAAALGVGELAESVDIVDAEIIDAADSIEGLGTTLEQTAAPVGEMTEGADQLQLSLWQVIVASEAVGIEFEDLDDLSTILGVDLTDAGLSAGELSQAFENVAAQGDQVVQGYTAIALGTGEAAEATDSMTVSLDDVVEAAIQANLQFDDLEDLGNQLGLTLTEAGVDVNEFAQALGIAIVNAATGEGVMEDLGLAVDNVALGITSWGTDMNDFDRDFQGLTFTLAEAVQTLVGLNLAFLDVDGTLSGLGQTGVEAEEFLGGLGLVFENGLIDAEQFSGAVAQILEQFTAETLEASDSGQGAFSSLFSTLVSGAASGGEAVFGMATLITVAVLDLIPLVGVLIGAIGGIAQAAAIGFGGLGVFLLAAEPELKWLEGEIKLIYDQWAKPFGPIVDPVLGEIAITVKELLEDVTTLVPAAAAGMSGFVGVFAQAFESPGFKSFVNWVGQEMPYAMTEFGHFLANIGGAFGTMGEKGSGFVNMMIRGFESLSEDIKRFANSNDFKDFVAWLEKNGPGIESDFKRIADSIGHVITELAPYAIQLLAITADIIEDLSNVVKWTLDATQHIVHFFEDVYDGFIDMYWVIEAAAKGIGHWLNEVSKMGPSTKDAVTAAGHWLDENIWAPLVQYTHDAERDIKEAWDHISGAAKSAYNTMQNDVFHPLEQAIGDIIEVVELLVGSVVTAWNIIVSNVQTGYDELQSDVFHPIESVFTTTIPNAIQETAGFFERLPSEILGAIEGIPSLLEGIFSPIASWVYNNVIQPVVSFFHGLPGEIAGAIGTGLTVLESFGEGLIHGIENGVSNAIGGLGSFITSEVMSHIPHGTVHVGGVSIPYAEGGIIDTPTHALVGEAGPEAILPLSNPMRMAEILGQAADFTAPSVSAAAFSGGSSSGGGVDGPPQPIYILLDGKKLGEAMLPYQRSAALQGARATGDSLGRWAGSGPYR
jgi:hypothetical protein